MGVGEGLAVLAVLLVLVMAVAVIRRRRRARSRQHRGEEFIDVSSRLQAVLGPRPDPSRVVVPAEPPPAEPERASSPAALPHDPESAELPPLPQRSGPAELSPAAAQRHSAFTKLSPEQHRRLIIRVLALLGAHPVEPSGAAAPAARGAGPTRSPDDDVVIDLREREGEAAAPTGPERELPLDEDADAPSALR